MANIRFYRDFVFEYGALETVSPLIRRIVARNPGPFTGPGTATYVIGHGRVALIDPGPELASHITALLHALRGETISHLLITHAHLDHWPAAAAIQRASGARSYGFGPGRGKTVRGEEDDAAPEEISGEQGDAVDRNADGSFIPDQTLRDGDVLEGPDWRITAVHTPGHASDHLCYSLAGEGVLFSGDHVMGWSTSVISPPDGDMRAYLHSLEKLLGRDEKTYLPAHGPAITDPQRHVRAFIEHRRERRAAILRRIDAGDRTIPEIVAGIYAGLPAGLRGAAARSVLAHLIELAASGEVECDGEPGLDGRYRLASGH
jgi:glyoxylase-like metal-dependent hydrolase (beta-lactamase superfamily II)